MVPPIDRIRQDVADLSVVRKHLSLWLDRGVADESCSLHSVGMSYWSVLGTVLGYEAISEMPAPHNGPYAFVGDDVRNDAAWFTVQQQEPVVLVEFERYGGPADQEKLVGKVDNLLLAHHRWGKRPRTLVLAYWTKGLATLPDHTMLRQRTRNGFITRARENVPGSLDCEVHFFQAVHQQTMDSAWRLSQIIERGVL
jgi:hypothetical protein